MSPAEPVLSVQVHKDGAPVSCTLQYSADTYGNGKIDTLPELCKALFAYSDTYCCSTQIARVRYEPNASYTYTDLNRCTNFCFGSASTTRMGVTLRVVACVNGQYTVFRHQNTDREFNYSFYDTDKLNALPDKGVRCNLNTDVARAVCITSFMQSESDRIQPYGNYQGMDLTSAFCANPSLPTPMPQRLTSSKADP